MSCNTQGHPVGEIQNKIVRAPEWEEAVSAFEEVINDFNIRGRREQINHPGWCHTFQFCPDCGVKLEPDLLQKPNWKTEEESGLRRSSLSPSKR